MTLSIYLLLAILILLILLVILSILPKSSNNNLEQLIKDSLNNSKDELIQSVERSQSLLLQQLQYQQTELKAFTKQLIDFQEKINNSFQSNRSELNDTLLQVTKTQNEQLNSFQQQLSKLTELNNAKFTQLQEAQYNTLNQMSTNINNKLEDLQKDNAIQLDKMRHTVDEKLQATLEKRLGTSFQLVTKQLESVQRGLGEMQQLANGVGDLKKVLSNVKTRGILGEIQLGNILEQILTNDQYALNVSTIPGSSAYVEFAIKFPGKSNDDRPIWLPIDSKFPMDKYEQLLDAYDQNDIALIETQQKALVNTIKVMAKDIQQKYISPPHTTDFGILFLPVEGLYAETVRQPGLMELLQREYKIILAGPSNLAAFLNSIQMGFRTLAIEKRSSEVWKVLSNVKTEFGKFGQVIQKVNEKLQQASKTIDTVGVRTRAIERNLRDVESLPNNEKTNLLDDNIITRDELGL